MNTSKHKTNVKIGACGVACEVCKLFIEKKCIGCISGTACTKKPRCPILECAWKKGISYCTRDCKEFPCEEFYNGYCTPYSKQKLDYFKKKSNKIPNVKTQIPNNI